MVLLGGSHCGAVSSNCANQYHCGAVRGQSLWCCQWTVIVVLLVDSHCGAVSGQSLWCC